MGDKMPPYYLTCRVTIAILNTLGYTFVYILRINLSIAIVCMVRDPQPSMNASNITIDNYTIKEAENFSLTILNDGLESACRDDDDSGVKSKVFDGEFEWDKDIRGLLLSSFFYGYIVTQIPGGWLATKFGPKNVFGVAMVINVIGTLLTPLAAKGSVYLLMAIRIVIGLCQGVCFPCTHHLWGRWAPPLERSKLVAFSYAGTIIGTIIAMSVSSLLCATNIGWPLIFYIFGAATGVWCIAWFYAVYDTPEQHPRITMAEKKYIMDSVGHGVYKKGGSVPWRSIWLSPPVWAIVVAHTCNNWGGYTILTCIPMYMREVLHFDIKKNGALSALPYMVMYFMALFGGFLADFVRQRKILSTTAVRKIWQSLAFFPCAVCIVVMGFMGCEVRYVAVALLTIAITFTAMGRSGYGVNHVDIAPRYAGVLFGISNTAATIPGFVTPTLVGILTPNGSQAEWQKVFFICGGAYAFGGIFYCVFANGQEQTWARETTRQTEDPEASHGLVITVNGESENGASEKDLKS